MPDTSLRGPCADAAGDYTVAQDMAGYGAVDHATWRELAALPVAMASLGPPIPAGASTALDQPL